MATSGDRRIARARRAKRVRKKVRGTDVRPRLSVFRSNRHLYVQVISDESGRTLAAVSTAAGDATGKTKTAATELGRSIAGKCKELSIAQVVLDRRGYQYRGRVKAITESAREAGLRI